MELCYFDELMPQQLPSDKAYELRVCVIIPCHNEALTIAKVVNDFARVCPSAEIVVVDNASSDNTCLIANSCGARVIYESRLGKGYAIRRGFISVDADAYFIVDGDATYSPDTAGEMLERFSQGYDVVLARRVPIYDQNNSYRRGHQFGNRMLTRISKWLLGFAGQDSLTGFRLMSRRFVKSFTADSRGFEIETDLNSHANLVGIEPFEIASPYYSRADGSSSKLRTYRDGIRLIARNIKLFRLSRPLLFFSMLGSPLLLFALGLGMYVSWFYFTTGLVSNFPSLIVGVGCVILFSILWLAGLFNQNVARLRQEIICLAFNSDACGGTRAEPASHNRRMSHDLTKNYIDEKS